MELIKAIFLERINRFVIRAQLGNQEVLAYLPNPGRLWELLLQGVELLLMPTPENKYKYTLIACLKDGKPVLLHTHYTNRYIKNLIAEGRFSYLSDYEIIMEEPRVGQGRLDFLLRHKGTKKNLYLEIKTCTLFGSKLAMFPDAETKRGTRHLYELASLTKKGNEAGCIFVVMHPEVEYFLPAYHIDFAFTQAFMETFSQVKYWAIAVSFDEELTRISSVKPLTIPMELLKREFGNWGSYLLILRVNTKFSTNIGNLKNLTFAEGYYVYVGSAKKNLRQRLERYRRGSKKKHWHIDYLLERAKLTKIVPIVSSEPLECQLASRLALIADDRIKNFGASDCNCLSHLFYFKGDPLNLPAFINLINYFRLERPLERAQII